MAWGGLSQLWLCWLCSRGRGQGGETAGEESGPSFLCFIYIICILVGCGSKCAHSHFHSGSPTGQRVLNHFFVSHSIIVALITPCLAMRIRGFPSDSGPFAGSARWCSLLRRSLPTIRLQVRPSYSPFTPRHANVGYAHWTETDAIQGRVAYARRRSIWARQTLRYRPRSHTKDLARWAGCSQHIGTMLWYCD